MQHTADLEFRDELTRGSSKISCGRPLATGVRPLWNASWRCQTLVSCVHVLRILRSRFRNLAKVLIASSSHHPFVLVTRHLASPSCSPKLMKDVFCSAALSANLPRLSSLRTPNTKILPARFHSWIHKMYTKKVTQWTNVLPSHD